MMRIASAVRRAGCAGAFTLLIAAPVLRAVEAVPPPPPLLGAEAVLRELAATRPPPAASDDFAGQLKAFVAATHELRDGHAQLPPRQAAERWLALWDRLSALSGHMRGTEFLDRRSVLAALFSALPGPESWPEFDALLQRRLAVVGGQEATFASLPALLNDGLPRPGARTLTGQHFIALLLQEKYDEAAALAGQLNEGLAGEFRRIKDSAQPPPFAARLEAALAQTREDSSELDVPDLLPALGAEPVRTIARRVLLARTELRFSIAGAGTRALFREEAIKLVKDLPRPPWSLCLGPGGGPLQAALVARFGDPLAPAAAANTPAARSSREEAIEAAQWRALEALRDRRPEEAERLLTALAAKPPSTCLLREIDIDPAFAFETCSIVAGKTRSAALLPMMLELAPRAGPVDHVLAIIRNTWTGTLADAPLWSARLETDLRLAHGEIEPAVAALRTVLEASRRAALAHVAAEAPGAVDQMPDPDAAPNATSLWADAAVRESVLGLALGRDDLVGAGLAEIEAMLGSLPADRRSSGAIEYEPFRLADELLAAGRLAEAEHLCVLQLRRFNGEEFRSIQGRALALLARIYDRANRPADVIRLLVEAPQWERADLAGLGHEGLWMAAARALAATGRQDEALAIVRAQLDQHAEDDAAYALLLDLRGADALPLLDQLMAADRWQERPLIWKAELLRRLGRLSEAEAAARAALAIDPTDGEQVAGARVRGYAVLGDILEAAGKKDDAAFFRRVVASVRIAEKGDQLREAGLLDAARQKYEEAEAAFADAYCVQWRLGYSLERAGRIAEAEKHYEIAFTRMPEQFGRLAALCFGCENIFGNETSRGAAERVLSRLAAAPNPRPQVFLILARLRLQQDRPTEAWNEFQRAVALDPEHFDSWIELAGLVRKVDPPADQRRTIVRRLLALDPLLKHASLDAGDFGVLGPRGLWELQQRGAAAPAPATALLALPAAANRLQSSDQDRYTIAVDRQQAMFPEFAADPWHVQPNRLLVAWLEPVLASSGLGSEY